MQKREKNLTHNLEIKDGIFSQSPCFKEINMSTTMNSSHFSAFKTCDETYEMNCTYAQNIQNLKSKIHKLEKQNKSLKQQVYEWKERCDEIKQHREIVKTQVTKSIHDELLKLQSQQGKEHDELRNQLKTLQEKYNKLQTEKFEEFRKQNKAEKEMAELKKELNTVSEEFKVKEKLMQVALSKTLKSKLSEPIVKYLLSSVYKNPLGLARYFSNKKQKVIQFLTYCLQKYECDLAKDHDKQEDSPLF